MDLYEIMKCSVCSLICSTGKNPKQRVTAQQHLSTKRLYTVMSAVLNSPISENRHYAPSFAPSSSTNTNADIYLIPKGCSRSMKCNYPASLKIYINSVFITITIAGQPSFIKPNGH